MPLLRSCVPRKWSLPPVKVPKYRLLSLCRSFKSQSSKMHVGRESPLCTTWKQGSTPTQKMLGSAPVTWRRLLSLGYPPRLLSLLHRYCNNLDTRACRATPSHLRSAGSRAWAASPCLLASLPAPGSWLQEGANQRGYSPRITLTGNGALCLPNESPRQIDFFFF